MGDMSRFRILWGGPYKTPAPERESVARVQEEREKVRLPARRIDRSTDNTQTHIPEARVQTFTACGCGGHRHTRCKGG